MHFNFYTNNFYYNNHTKIEKLTNVRKKGQVYFKLNWTNKIIYPENIDIN